ncbi:MAG TPA: molybdopterin-dependent oxidoreductase [Vicinamibacterales bacterium]|nr:molybdopterin-dependent oxidoreductase [Vicinamibacterales bacterium]
MATEFTRRDTLKYGAAAAALFALPDWAVPALAQGEVDVAFTDYPANWVAANPNGNNRFLDLRKIDGLITPNDQFFFIQHYGKPELDGAKHRIKVTGLVSKPLELSLADLQAMPKAEIMNGYECSGNSGRAMQGLSSNGRFTGVRLRDVLKRAGLGDKAREVVFFGADRGNEEVVFRQQTFKIQQQFARSITLENAQKPEPMLVYALNGQPLTRDSGFPVRMMMPGWYGVANVKWLSEIHLQEGRFLGNYQARWYRTMRTVGGAGTETDPETQWVETEVTRLNLKSTIARVTKLGDVHRVRGWVLNDGTPLRSVEVKVDDGPWKPAVLDAANTKHSWKLFTYTWEGATPGEHTIVSRVTDATGQVQPTAADLARKKTFLEDNSQFPRKVMIA